MTTTETAVVPVDHSWEASKRGAIGPNGKFNEERRLRYLEERRKGTPHLTAVRRAGISPNTYDRYSAAIGQQWKDTVRWVVEESLDPIRAVRRAAALAGEPWAVRAELGPGRDIGRGAAGSDGGGVVNIGTIVVGGAEGVAAGLAGILGRLREREAALESEAGSPGDELEVLAERTE